MFSEEELKVLCEAVDASLHQAVNDVTCWNEDEIEAMKLALWKIELIKFVREGEFDKAIDCVNAIELNRERYTRTC